MMCVNHMMSQCHYYSSYMYFHDKLNKGIQCLTITITVMAQNLITENL